MAFLLLSFKLDSYWCFHRGFVIGMFVCEEWWLLWNSTTQHVPGRFCWDLFTQLRSWSQLVFQICMSHCCTRGLFTSYSVDFLFCGRVFLCFHCNFFICVVRSSPEKSKWRAQRNLSSDHHWLDIGLNTSWTLAGLQAVPTNTALSSIIKKLSHERFSVCCLYLSNREENANGIYGNS